MPTGQTYGTAPILCAHLLRKVDHELTSLLRPLKPEDWGLQTVAPAWKVREVVAHLLDTALRKVSFVHDGRRPGKWQFGNETGAAVACHITIPQEFAWRLFTKGIDRTAARSHVDIEGRCRPRREDSHPDLDRWLENLG